MSANIFGQHFKFISFGESHGSAYGVVIDGIPAGITFNHELLNKELNRRKPGQSKITSAREESDQPEILSGVFENKTLGTPIAVVVKNNNQHSEDYDEIKNNPRIGHADDVWKNKFGHADHRGGGRSSGRETINRVIAGSFAQMYVNHVDSALSVLAKPIQIGPHKINFRSELPELIHDFLNKAKEQGESYGGIVQCKILNPPKNLGQPVFHKLKADLASAMLGIGAVEGFEFGAGFSAIDKKGSEFHDVADSSNYGGIRGGISTGEEIIFNIAFKPTSSIMDIAKKGRHDPCIVIRALPVVEAMAWVVLADHMLWMRNDRI